MHALTHFVSSKFKLKFTLKFKLKSVPHLNFSLKIPLILCPFIHAQAKLIITLRACWSEFGADYVAYKEI